MSSLTEQELTSIARLTDRAEGAVHVIITAVDGLIPKRTGPTETAPPWCAVTGALAARRPLAGRALTCRGLTELPCGAEALCAAEYGG